MRVLSLSLMICLSVALNCSAQTRPGFAVDDEQVQTPEQTAKTLNVLPVFERLRSLATSSDSQNALEAMRLNQRLLMEVTTASLEVDATMGEIDAEIAETWELKNYLAARRQRRIDLLNLASLGIGGSVGTASAALGLTEHTRASGVLGVIAGSSTTTLSVIGLGVRTRGSGRLEVPSNMLARIFDLPSDPNNIYPAVVARFMNSPAPNDTEQMTRQQRLISTWSRLGRIPAMGSAQAKEKMRRMASRPGDGIELSINELDDRQAMLYDFRARLTFMKRDLAALLSGVPREQTASESGRCDCAVTMRSAIQLGLCVSELLLCLGQLLFALLDLLCVALGLGLLQVGLALGDLLLRVHDLLLPLPGERGVGAVRLVLLERLAQACLLLAVAGGVRLRNLLVQLLLFGGAAGGCGLLCERRSGAQ